MAREFCKVNAIGKFVVVGTQHMLSDAAIITHAKLIAALMAEAGHKQTSRAIGFLREIHQ